MNNKKIVVYVLIILALCLSSISFADGSETSININPKVINADIVINGFGFDNSMSENPILSYNGVLYLPLTKPILESLGYELKLNDSQLFQLSIKNNCKFYDETKHKYSKNVLSGTVEGKIYDKELIINEKTINGKDDFQKAIFYNNSIYVPLNFENVRYELQLNIAWNDDKKLVINRNPDFNTLGIIDFEIKKQNKEEMKLIKEELDKMVDLIISKNQKKKFSGQTEYYYDSEIVEYTYVDWDNGDKMIIKNPKDELATVVYYYGSDKHYYVGHYKDGSFFGKGMYVYEDGRRSEITTYVDKDSKTDDKIKYSEKINDNKYALPVLVVLTEFNDVRFSTNKSDWQESIFGEGDNNLKGYYKDISDGKIDFIPIIENNGVANDGVVKIRLNEDHPDFGEDNSLNYTILQKSLLQLDSEIDFSIYDRNDDGVIQENEIIIINVVAGYESSAELPVFSKSIWAHKGELAEGAVIFDDVMVSTYCQIGELVYEKKKSIISNMTILAHEVGHILGLPDFYDTDQSSQGLGPFSLMGEGTNNNIVGKLRGSIIPEFDPWSKIKLGIISPEIVVESGEYSLFTKSSGKYNVLKIETHDPNEYFLLENKLLDGRDFTIASYTEKKGGVLIYHVDNNIIDKKYFENKINNDEKHKGVDLEESDEALVGHSVLDKNTYDEYLNPFYTSRGISVFSEDTTPNSSLYNGDYSGIKIEILSDGLESRIKITK